MLHSNTSAYQDRRHWIMNKNYSYTIEVRVPNGSKGWQKLVNDKMRQAIEKLTSTVEELGGNACVRY